MTALLVSSDLMFASKFEAAGRRRNLAVQTARTLDLAIDKAGASAFDLVVLDLSLAGLDPAKLVAQLRGLEHPPRTIVAYAPHVHESRLEAARAAGCDRVLTRGQFDRGMEQLLAESSG